MKKYLIGIAFILIVVLGIHFYNVISYNNTKNNIRILTEEYSPLQYLEEGELKGVAVDVVHDLLAELDLEKEIELMDWNEGYNLTLDEPNVALFSMMKNNEREDLFKWVGPIGTLKVNFYALSNNKIIIKDLEDLNDFKISAVKDYGYTQDLKEKGFQNIIEYNREREALDALLASEVDLYLTSNIILSNFIENGIMDLNEIEREYNFSIEQFYIAFSKDYSDKVLKDWEEALLKIKEKSTLVFIKNDI